MTQLTIHIDLDTLSKESGIDPATNDDGIAATGSALTDLATIIKESPGKTQLTFSIRESRLSPQPVRLASRLPGIKVSRRLVDFVRAHESMSLSM